MSGSQSVQLRCPRCGHQYEASNDELPAAAVYRRWHVKDRASLKAYVQSLGTETHEWLLALFVDGELNLLAVDTIARGTVSECECNFRRIVSRGLALKAAGFILVHNHPSGDPRPSASDCRITSRLRHVSAQLEMPLLDHFIIAGDEMISVGGF